MMKSMSEGELRLLQEQFRLLDRSNDFVERGLGEPPKQKRSFWPAFLKKRQTQEREPLLAPARNEIATIVPGEIPPSKPVRRKWWR